jgi:nucleotide-binding universal stress UspA family protein
MYRLIVVPLDGSAAAEHALPTALSLARRFGAALQIIHVNVPVWGMSGEVEWYHDGLDRELRKEGQSYLDGMRRRLSTVADIAMSFALLDGLAASTINRHAVAAKADLIVMTTHGRGPLARIWLGSVSDELVRHACIPILFVSPHETEADVGRDALFDRIIVPLDGSILAEQILATVTPFASATQVEIMLVRVVQQWLQTRYAAGGKRVGGLRPSLRNQLQVIDEQERNNAAKYLERMAKQLREDSLVVTTRVLTQQSPASAILNCATAQKNALIAMATHGHGGLKRLLVGSVTDKVLRGGRVPVLVQRPTDKLVVPSDDAAYDTSHAPCEV